MKSMNLISKKDLLAITGISYGQLYRWKRERLIPEEWFIKQSAYTGQETFFPRDQILSRIKSILDLKDAYSLEELAKILSPETSVAKISLQDLTEVSEIDQGLLEAMPEIYGEDRFEFFEVALAAAVSQAAKKIGLTKEQAAQMLKKSTSAASSQKSVNISCTVFYSDGEYHTMFSPNAIPVAFDGSIEVKEQLSLSEITDTIKIKYKALFIK
jgi:DNA-binding transcriptional MerR regulator